MKIYVLDRDPHICAEYHCDKHISIRIIDATEILFSAQEDRAMRYHSSIIKQFGMNRAKILNDIKHPHCLWVRESIQNYRWLYKFGLALCKEYLFRWRKTHEYEYYIKWLREYEPPLPDIGPTDFKILLPDEYNTGDPVESYRKYYINEKKTIANWKRRDRPYWFEDNKSLENKRNPKNKKNRKNWVDILFDEIILLFSEKRFDLPVNESYGLYYSGKDHLNEFDVILKQLTKKELLSLFKILSSKLIQYDHLTKIDSAINKQSKNFIISSVRHLIYRLVAYWEEDIRTKIESMGIYSKEDYLRHPIDRN
ncbi:MAG: hypothetical protein PVJ36_09165, partial [Nitrospirota bacterium]